MIAIGTACRLEQTVTEEYTAATIGSGMLPVFATPYMAAMMERAAQSCLIPYLDKSMGSVGIRLNITHDAPTPLGMKVYAEAEITSVSENGQTGGVLRSGLGRQGPYRLRHPHPGCHQQ